MDGDKVLYCAIGQWAPPFPPDAPAAYREFWRLWAEEKFFECHEVLEDEWRQTLGPRKLFYNGLIHGAVAVYQHRRGNAVGAARQLLRARLKLKRLGIKYFEVDSEEFIARVEAEISDSLLAVSPRERASWPALTQAIEKRIEREWNSGFDQVNNHDIQPAFP